VLPAERREELQRALIRSHAAGLGAPLEREVVRAMMLLRARTLVMGCSGARPVLADAIIALLNEGLTPLVPEHGSLGASGDLAPLAHCALALMGEGEVLDQDGATRPAADALRQAGIEPVVLDAKEGLALINGTDGMLGMLALACADAELRFRTADITAAMSAEALMGTDRTFQPRLHEIRPHPGQVASAANLMRLMRGSGIVTSHRHSHHAVQDSYSVRCSPQVAGAARDTLEFARRIAAVELDSAVDNPVVLESGEVESTGNFHGEPLAFAADFLAIAAAEVGAIAERRVDRLLDPHRSEGLPPFLAEEPGVNSGLMVAQYTAAALVVGSARAAERLGVKPLARIVACATSGVAPKDIFLAPVYAVRQVLDRAGWAPGDVDLFELNEAFAAQMLACGKELHLDEDRVNVQGGAIALGHPIGASGARSIGSLIDEMHRRGVEYSAASICSIWSPRIRSMTRSSICRMKRSSSPGMLPSFTSLRSPL